mmetsp:Transcript_2704/g.9671  ORF Transcript_2704/g.9671 Transcript_2704/m.9671 type:complete len:283 (-) Transcript_2704:1274-2122(-)
MLLGAESRIDFNLSSAADRRFQLPSAVSRSKASVIFKLKSAAQQPVLLLLFFLLMLLPLLLLVLAFFLSLRSCFLFGAAATFSPAPAFFGAVEFADGSAGVIFAHISFIFFILLSSTPARCCEESVFIPPALPASVPRNSCEAFLVSGSLSSKSLTTVATNSLALIVFFASCNENDALDRVNHFKVSNFALPTLCCNPYFTTSSGESQNAKHRNEMASNVFAIALVTNAFLSFNLSSKALSSIFASLLKSALAFKHNFSIDFDASATQFALASFEMTFLSTF